MNPMRPLPRLILRDMSLMAIGALLWALTLQSASINTLAVIALNGLTALMTVLLGYLLHEWGHLAGAWISGSVVHLPAGAWGSPFLFRFDTGRNNRQQFLAMSAGGFIASALVVAALLLLLPMPLLASRLALGLTVLGVLATFMLEIPPAWRVYRGNAMPVGVAFVNEMEP